MLKSITRSALSTAAAQNPRDTMGSFSILLRLQRRQDRLRLPHLRAPLGEREV